MTDKSVTEQAASWVARGDASPLDEASQQELNGWLDADPRHRGAYLRALAAWHLLDRGRALAGEKREPRLLLRSSNRKAYIWVSGVLAAGIAGFTVFQLSATHLHTQLGELRRIPLADGSLAELNTQSELEISMTHQERQVRLKEGEVWFQVAKDPTRPFVVAAGSVRVQALGTSFAVRRHAAGVEVLVTEGAVATWVSGQEQNKLRVAAGSKANFSEKTTQPPSTAPVDPADIDRTLAWREGQIVFKGTTLADAVAEFNRYNARKIVVTQPSLQSRRVVGWFHTNDPAGFAEAAARMLGGKVAEEKDTIQIGGQ